MMQNAINNSNEEQLANSVLVDTKTMTHADSNLDISQKFFNKTQKIKGISNSITVLSSKNRSCSRSKVVGDGGDDK